MAFLDNSGDIILDAVLTDTGRYRLAKGDGSFKITKFALGDDEIDYSLYNKDHPSGSAYYDLDILQTPVLEALTDNASALKSHLVTINQTDMLFLPMMKLYTNAGNNGGQTYNNSGFFIVCVDTDTEERFIDQNGETPLGVFYTTARNTNRIVVHQGLDTPQISPLRSIPSELSETVYMLEFDNRLGSLFPVSQQRELERSYVDDDQIATYMVSTQRNSDVVAPIRTNSINPEIDSSIRGPRGTSLTLSIAASLDLQSSTYLFEELGSVLENFAAPNGSTPDLYYIDTNLRVTGANTGYRIDIPVRIVKFKNP